jgi:hypothetical protein
MLEREREEMKTHAATQAAAIVEVKGQVDVANKALEAQRAANRELEVHINYQLCWLKQGQLNTHHFLI